MKNLFIGALLLCSAHKTYSMFLAGQGLKVVSDLREHEASKTPLHHAAGKGDSSLCLDILQQGDDINATTNETAVHWAETPLHFAAKAGHSKACEALLRFKSEMNFSYKRNWTPLHAAAENNQEETSAVLLDNGFDPEVVSEGGFTVLPRTCLDIAKKNGNLELCRLITTRGWAIPLYKEKLLFDTANQYLVRKIESGVNWLLGRKKERANTAYDRIITVLSCLRVAFPNCPRDIRLYIMSCCNEEMGDDVFEILLPKLNKILKEQPLSALKNSIPTQLLPLVHAKIFLYSLAKIERLLQKDFLEEARVIQPLVLEATPEQILESQCDVIQLARLHAVQQEIEKYKNLAELTTNAQSLNPEIAAQHAQAVAREAFENLFQRHPDYVPMNETFKERAERKLQEALVAKDIIEFLYPKDFRERCGEEIYDNIGRLMAYKKSNVSAPIPGNSRSEK